METKLKSDLESGTVWKQERPDWCPVLTCSFRRRVQDSYCCGVLPEPEPHLDDFNYYRMCYHIMEDGSIDYYLVNNTDIDYLRWIMDALDGKKTSWLSRIVENMSERILKKEGG